ncbi:hypothetical protein N9335_03320 [Crocinitomicaceae bacterium]|nr:hypothetical protein [Crocinitomicaceae bacterium]
MNKYTFLVLFLGICSFAITQKKFSIDTSMIKTKLIERNSRDSIELRKYVIQYLENERLGKDYRFDWFHIGGDYIRLLGGFEQLKHYSDSLVPVLFKYIRKDRQCLRALAIFDLPKHMKDSILGLKEVPDYIRARLGDSLVEKQIINNFHRLYNKPDLNSKELEELRRLSNQLTYIRSNAVIDEFLNSLESEKIDEYEGVTSSRINMILNAYRLIYPESAILLNRFYASNFRQIKSRTPELESYFLQIENYILQNHNKKIKINAPFLSYGHRTVYE